MLKVKCYRNLNRKGVVWSIVDTASGRVVARTSTAYISNAVLTVSAKGRARVLKEKRKNVHAFVRGHRLAISPRNTIWYRAEYNPYKNDSFVLSESKQRIFTARYAKLTKTGLYVSL